MQTLWQNQTRCPTDVKEEIEDVILKNLHLECNSVCTYFIILMVNLNSFVINAILFALLMNLKYHYNDLRNILFESFII